MRFCTNCGAKVESEQRFCVLCGKEIQTSSNTLGDMGISKNEATSGSLFDKMESNVSIEDNQPIAAVNEEQQRIEREQQERAFAKAYLEKQDSLKKNYLLGFVGALVGGLIAAIPWAIVSSQGWFVAWLGYLIAVAASKGYDLMKVKTDMKKLWCVAGAVIICVLAGQIMSDMISIAMDEELGGVFSIVFEYYMNNFVEYLSINAGNLVLGYIFAALGGFSVLRNIKKESAILDELRKKYSERGI